MTGLVNRKEREQCYERKRITEIDIAVDHLLLGAVIKYIL